MKKIKVGSDFSGVGAFDQALKRLKIDYQTIYACDWDKYARETFIHNYGEPEYYPKDVYEREIPSESLDIYMTSPPCQSFSLAGKRLGKDDKRGVLFFNSHEFIQVNKPRYFIFENVKGLLSDDNGKTFSEWVAMLGGKSVNGNPVLFPYEDSVPYHLYWKVLNAKQHGIPQNRERVFLIGIRDNQDNNFRFPIEEHLTKRLKDVLEEEVFEKFYLSDLAIQKCLKSQANKDLLIKEVSNISKCIVAGYYKIPFDAQYIKVQSNLEKYFLSEKTIENLLVYNERQKENERGFSAKFRDVNEIKIMDALKVGGGKDDLIKIKSATSTAFEIATEGDSINFSQMNSKTRRGRVGHQVAQTLDTSCNQGIFITENYLQWDSNGKNNKSSYDRAYFENKCSGTLLTKQPNNVLLNNFKIRRLTPRECFRLMDFPDSFTWPVSDSQAYKQAGNSIVVNVLLKIIKNLNL